MPIISVGNFNQVDLKLKEGGTVRKISTKKKGKDTELKFPKVFNAEVLKDISSDILPPKVDLLESDKKWSLYIKNILLKEGFEGIFGNTLGESNEIYFVSVCWDYSGSIPFVYPPVKEGDAARFLNSVKPGVIREFIGDGIQIWPSQKVKGGLNIIIFVYECDQDVRDLGKILKSVHNTVSNSKLTSLIGAISVSPALATGVAVTEAVNELVGVIGSILEENQDDYVDLFQGTYGTEKVQTSGAKKYEHEVVSVTLDFNIAG